MSVSAEQISQVRAFNRDYTRRIGVLSRGLLGSPWSLTEVRVMYEVAHRPGVTAGQLAAWLALDRGYLSRILRSFEGQRLLARAPAAEDARRRRLRLTAHGRRVLAPLERRSRAQVRAMLSGLDDSRRRALLDAMGLIRGTLGAAEAGQEEQRPTGASPPRARAQAAPSLQDLVLRPHRPGDMGWVVERHGALYHQEYGWNEEFEGLVAGIAAAFLEKLDPVRERCWIAERDGRRLGCVFLVRQSSRTAKLRLLLVEPEARGLGLGRRLIAECARFARRAGYERILLWTQSNLAAARHLYAQAGFVRIARQRHRSFGHELIAETWRLDLRATRSDAARGRPTLKPARVRAPS
jgi:DNA-binding MarR family transcriptional regulator/N-acetylglutamate synthase-like GNAT family acetyltransferase